MPLPSNPPATTTPAALKTWAQNVVDTVTVHDSAIAAKADLAGPTFTGEPIAPSLRVTGKTGATDTPIRLAGGTTSGPPTTGAHLKGEIVFDDTGTGWYCTVAGTPGTWARTGGTSPLETQVQPTLADPWNGYPGLDMADDAGGAKQLFVSSGDLDTFVAPYAFSYINATGDTPIAEVASYAEDAASATAGHLARADTLQANVYAGVIGTSRAELNAISTEAALRLLVGSIDTKIKATSAGLQINDAAEVMGFNGVTPITRPTVTGSRGGNAALASLLAALDDLGLITDSSSA